MAIVAAVALALAGAGRLPPTRQLTEPKGEEIQLGVDRNGDGVLEEDEVEETAYIDVGDVE